MLLDLPHLLLSERVLEGAGHGPTALALVEDLDELVGIDGPSDSLADALVAKRGFTDVEVKVHGPGPHPLDRGNARVTLCHGGRFVGAQLAGEPFELL